VGDVIRAAKPESGVLESVGVEGAGFAGEAGVRVEPKSSPGIRVAWTFLRLDQTESFKKSAFNWKKLCWCKDYKMRKRFFEH